MDKSGNVLSAISKGTAVFDFVWSGDTAIAARAYMLYPCLEVR